MVNSYVDENAFEVHQRAEIKNANQKERDMLNQGKGKGALLGVKADFAGQRFPEVIERRHLPAEQP